ncbi:MAG: helix-turn-helix domain-containing protein [Hyphomonas sp.]
MAHNNESDEIIPEVDATEDAAMSDAETPASPSESTQEFTPEQRAKVIFDTRQYEGEDLRMGQVLRRVREALGAELQDVVTATLIRKDTLMSIERMETTAIPSGFLVPYLKTYAKHLGLSERDVVSAYTQECGAVEQVGETAPVPKLGELRPERAKWPIALAAAAVLAVFGGAGIGVYTLLKPTEELASVPAIVAVNGARDSLFSEAATSTRPLPKHLPLELVAVSQGWLEVRGSDGTIFRSRVMASGDTYVPRLGAGWTVNARNGGDFVWRVGDMVIGPLGPDGAPVHSASVDEQLVHAAELASPQVAAAGGGVASR